MATKDYLHPNWQKKRLEILERDNFTCQLCENKNKTLHVHHQYYIKNRKIWDYLNSCFITLCEDCHRAVHDEKIETTLNRMEFLHFKIEEMREKFQSRNFVGDYYRALLDSMSDFQCYLPFYWTKDRNIARENDIPSMDYIEGALTNNIKWKNFHKYIAYCCMYGEIVDIKYIKKEQSEVRRFLNGKA